MIPHIGISLRQIKVYVPTKTCTWVSIAILLAIAQNWEKPKCPSTGEQMNKKNTCYVIPHIWISRKCKLMCSNRKQISCHWGLESGEDSSVGWEGLQKDMRKLLGVMDIFIMLNVSWWFHDFYVFQNWSNFMTGIYTESCMLNITQ